MGLFGLSTETIAATLDLFLQRYNINMNTAIRITLTTSLENLQIELGIPNNSLKYNFEIWGSLATHSWIKSLWEKISTFLIDVLLKYETILTP